MSVKQIPTEIEEFQTNPIFFNENIKIGNRSVYNKSCIENGLIYINDIIKENGNIFSYEELKRTYNININFLQYSGLVKSILDWKKKLNLENMKNKAETPIVPFGFKIYIKSKKGTQDMYKLINECKESSNGRIAWDKRYTFNDMEWKHIFKEPYRLTRDTPMQCFKPE